MSELKLKPCPFCGGEAKIGNPYPKTFLIWCRNCHIGTTNCPSRKRAFELWNRRTPMDNIVEKLEEYAKSKICDNHKKRCPYGDNNDIFCENCGALGATNIVKQEINNGLE